MTGKQLEIAICLRVCGSKDGCRCCMSGTLETREWYYDMGLGDLQLVVIGNAKGFRRMWSSV
jgi:hypothetical protein